MPLEENIQIESGAGIGLKPVSISQAEATELATSIRGAVNLDTGTIRALASNDVALIAEIYSAVGNRHMLVTGAVIAELGRNLLRNPSMENLFRTAAVLSLTKMVQVMPSQRVMALPVSRRIGVLDKAIFGTGDALGITTFTSDRRFVNTAMNLGVPLNSFVHRPHMEGK